VVGGLDRRSPVQPPDESCVTGKKRSEPAVDVPYEAIRFLILREARQIPNDLKEKSETIGLLPVGQIRQIMTPWTARQRFVRRSAETLTPSVSLPPQGFRVDLRVDSKAA
jgi:hypothetical protein